jgi:hypothetical protein
MIENVVKLIIFDYEQSPYHDFSKYWKDHQTHYIIMFGGKDFNEIERELVKLHYISETVV